MGRGLIQCSEPPLMKHKWEMQKAHLGRSAECWLVGSRFCYCQPQIPMRRCDPWKMVLFRLAELSNQNPSRFMLLSLFPCSEHRKVLACAPSHCVGTAQHSKMRRKLQARSSLWRRLVTRGSHVIKDHALQSCDCRYPLGLQAHLFLPLLGWRGSSCAPGSHPTSSTA